MNEKFKPMQACIEKDFHHCKIVKKYELPENIKNSRTF